MTSFVDGTDHVVAGRYRLLEPLGAGSTAEVYRAVDIEQDRQVAVKVLTGTTDVGDPRRFANEIRMLAGLSHPNLVAASDAGTDHGAPFVVLDLVEGQTLRDLIRRGPLPVEEVRRLGAVLADVLAHVHGRHVVHRDIKPSNILVDAQGRPHLTDFGLALLADGTRLTRTGQMVGTAGYLAPEQVRGAEVAAPADVYALGLVLLECLTGHREYPGTEVEAAVARLHRPPHIPEDLPADLVRLLSLMTALTPRRRPDAATCAAALGAAQPGAVVAPPRQAAPTSVLPRPRTPRKPLLVGGAALVAAAGVVLALTSGTPPTSGTAPTPEAVPTTSPSTPSVPIPVANSAEASVSQQVVVATATQGAPGPAVVVPTPGDKRGAGNAGPGNNPAPGNGEPAKVKPAKEKDKGKGKPAP